jgi:hypothetical protein
MDDMEQPGISQDSDVADQTAAEEHQEVVDDHDQDDTSGADSQEQTDEEEEDEIEVDGRKFAMPKSAAEKLKAERLMHADYTRKTQEVAQERRSLAEAQEQHQRQVAEYQHYTKELAQVVAIDNQLDEYRKLDWQRLADEDPTLAQKLDLQRRALEDNRTKAVEAVTQKQNERALAEQQETAKRIQEAEAYVQREIKDWSPERATKVMEYVGKSGVNLDQEMARTLIRQPALLAIFNKAEKYDQLAKKQAAKPAPAPAAKPVTRVSASRPAAQNDPDKMSTEDWLKWRNGQLRKKR